MAPAELSDASLVARCADGDDASLAELYDRHGRAAYALALRIVRDAGLAQDAVQDAFLAVWRGAGAFDAGRGRPVTWILGLVHHKAVDLVRREQARPATPTETLPDRDARVDVAADAVAASERARIRAALGRLSPAQREVLELAYFGGLSQSEVADRLGEPIGTIKSRTHAALARLRELLHDEQAH